MDKTLLLKQAADLIALLGEDVVKDAMRWRYCEEHKEFPRYAHSNYPPWVLRHHYYTRARDAADDAISPESHLIPPREMQWKRREGD